MPTHPLTGATTESIPTVVLYTDGGELPDNGIQLPADAMPQGPLIDWHDRLLGEVNPISPQIGSSIVGSGSRDDDYANRKELRRGLEQQGYTVDASNGELDNLIAFYGTKGDGSLSADDLNRALTDGALVLSSDGHATVNNAAFQLAGTHLGQRVVTSGSGDDFRVNSKEMQRGFHDAGYDLQRDDNLDRLIAYYGHTGGGSLSADEINQALKDGALILSADGKVTVHPENFPSGQTGYAAQRIVQASSSDDAYVNRKELKAGLEAAGYHVDADDRTLDNLIAYYGQFGHGSLSADDINQAIKDGALVLSADGHATVNSDVLGAGRSNVGKRVVAVSWNPVDADASRMQLGFKAAGYKLVTDNKLDQLIAFYGHAGNGTLTADEIDQAIDDGALELTSDGKAVVHTEQFPAHQSGYSARRILNAGSTDDQYANGKELRKGLEAAGYHVYVQNTAFDALIAAYGKSNSGTLTADELNEAITDGALVLSPGGDATVNLDIVADKANGIKKGGSANPAGQGDAYTPPTPVEAVKLALSAGSTIEEVIAALDHAGVTNTAEQNDIIDAALHELGLSNDDIAALARDAAPDIAALGEQGVIDYLNDPNSDYSHPALDKLYAALQMRYQMSGFATGEADAAHALARSSTTRYDGAAAAARDGGISQSLLDGMPIAAEDEGSPNPGQTHYTSPTGRDELAVYDETGAERHLEKGLDALGLSPTGDTAIDGSALADISDDLKNVLGGDPPEAWDANSVVQILNAADILQIATNGSVLANVAVGQINGVPRAAGPSEDAYGTAVNNALKDRGLDGLSQEQIAQKMYSALTSKGFLDYISALPDDQRDDAVNRAVATLSFFDPALGQSAAASIEVARETGVVGAGRQLLEAANATMPEATLKGTSADDKTTAWGAVLTLVLGAMRQAAAAGGKGLELRASITAENLQAVAREFADLFPDDMSIENPGGTMDLSHIEQLITNSARLTPEQQQISLQVLKYMADSGWLKGAQFYTTVTSSLLAFAALGSRIVRVGPGQTPWSTTVGQVASMVGDVLSGTGAAAKVYAGLSNNWSTLKSYWDYLPVLPGISNYQKWSQALYAGQSLWSGSFLVAHGKKVKGAELILRGAFFLNSYVLQNGLQGRGAYGRVPNRYISYIQIFNSLAIAGLNLVLVGPASETAAERGD